ncbi:biotin--[acetyl-CoA-carboxylase] ligase [Ekhidna sp.]|uniref:biotin--[acetyl-CoA-carboxylase] ligase n=1 Tax=Ekhidna sp. TaxID=2608089 RepID=UPI003296C922
MVFLPQCHSTNDELVQMTRKSNEPEGTLVYTDDQQMGKGQRGNAWITEPGKNILMSVLLRPNFLSPSNQFYLNLISGLAIVDTLKSHVTSEVLLKWPNDVFINGNKISGVLIENNLRGNRLESAVVGIGINVNQQGFRINTATSLVMETNIEFDRNELIETLLCRLEKWYLQLKNGSTTYILDEYHKLLMWRGEVKIFKSKNEEFEGEIVGIDQHGKLAINQDGNLRTFGIKEVEFMR